MDRKYKQTLYASYIGYITQAIVNNLAPLLFVTFRKEFSISLEQIGFLITFNFGIQMFIDFISAKFVGQIGYKACIVAAHILSFFGLIGLGLFPYWFENPYHGLLLAIGLYAVGGGLIEVLISPIVEALPTDEKSSAMSLLHSFYCWGQVLVVVLSTLYFSTAGINHWKYLPLLWSLIPLFNAIFFTRVPINTLEDKGESLPVKNLFSMKMFWIFVVMMLCSGASELSMSQWASFFAESGLNVSKTLGDLLGPCMFAVFMGLSRTYYGKNGETIDLKKFISFSGFLCVLSYLIAVFSPLPLLSLLGCGLCGLSVGIMWPGVFSLASAYCPKGGTAMFAYLALAGDIGCAAGPSLVGTFSDIFNGSLKAGLIFAVIFPLVLISLIGVLKSKYSAISLKAQ
ncbi:MAG: MFS transporter [Lachnoclostridium sp.]|jgi:fucose permease